MMLASATTKRVFRSVADALGDDGWSVISAVKMRQGWGDIVHVRIHTPLSIGRRGQLGRVQTAIEEALAGQRHRVEVVWESFG